MDILKSLDVPKKSKIKTWFQRIVANQNEWNKIRPNIHKTLFAKEGISGYCSICKEKEAVVRCFTCFDNHLCHICDDIAHSCEPLHDRSFYQDGVEHKMRPVEYVLFKHGKFSIEETGDINIIFEIVD